MGKVTYFDVEYANSVNKSICQMGIMCENYDDGEPVYPELDIYVNPEDGFDTICTHIHGISADAVKDKPTFPVVWKDIEKYFTNSIIIGHNVAAADIDALIKNLTRYNIDIPELYYVDTLEIARKTIPSCCIESYSMTLLCKYFDIEIDNAHNAFDDACANADLIKALSKTFSINIDDFVHRYIQNDAKEFIRFVSNPKIRKAVSEFYGAITGIMIDEKINQAEYDYIVKWRDKNSQYKNKYEINAIIQVVNKVIADGVITAEEMQIVKDTVKQYVDEIECSQITLATQILAGILKGMTCDKDITYDECINLRSWLYENNYLRGHFPFDKIMSTLDTVLADNIISIGEAQMMLAQLDEILNPVETLKTEITDIKGKTVCLSGNFAFGQKSAVAKYIIEQGGIVEDSVKKSTDFLIVGDYECDAYSNGAYGTKVKKAIEYNQKGCNISIIRERDFIK